MAGTAAPRARRIVRLALVVLVVAALREAAFARNDRRAPLDDPGHAP